MQYNIILSGVGGQGILFLSTFLTAVAHAAGLHVKQSEVHGMAQRGGSVVAHLRFSDKEINSPLIPEKSADMIISMEPLEVYRYLNYAHKGTKIIAAADPVKNIPVYPDEEKISGNLKAAGALLLPKATNIQLAGAAAKFIPIDIDIFKETIGDIFKNKPADVLEKNKKDFEEGYAA
ncbi:MAG: indolepyruvate oxidoreductase subunit beta [Lactobacillales bacterium]|jgi:indolepyruvate ferredoxin oxidoreductase beta subunit|nr:indolepyruvate oxidoreductase subunit beta [Lactobacillales bacterium]